VCDSIIAGGCLPRRARRRRFDPSAGYQLRLSSACRWASRYWYWPLQKLQCISAWLLICLKVAGGSGGVDGGDGVGGRIQPSVFFSFLFGYSSLACDLARLWRGMCGLFPVRSPREGGTLQAPLCPPPSRPIRTNLALVSAEVPVGEAGRDVANS